MTHEKKVIKSYLLLLLNGFNAWRVGERWERSSRDTHQQLAGTSEQNQWTGSNRRRSGNTLFGRQFDEGKRLG